MKNLSGILNKLATVAAVAVALSSCNRAEYAVLPKTTPYHGAYHSEAVKPAPAPEVAAAPVREAAPQPEVAVAPAPVVAAPVAAPAVSVPAVAKAATPAPAAAPRKLNLVERAAVAKVMSKVNKVASKTSFSKKETAETTKLSGNIRTGIILLLIGALLGIFGGIIGLLGAIIAVIGVILIVLGLLDEV